ncbi:hypothetical protein [Pedobacter punctiformis]|uniref:Crp/Fnr family transcriptional regulator n=1 Tax=Pedobacter punctiformis TaxID=3004097 RepID=A0ABT4L6J4_9SPHI|nr:hypothetical protein [Pedobacter sp. HCMS5-2]MCZ4243544.1 hypothetical protein [Pedobacter sp. HCMS5-2]
MLSLPLTTLKLKLQSLGALRSDAWVLISETIQCSVIKTDENFNRQEGQIAWLSNGLFKEYDADERKRPSIVNFIPQGHCILTRKLNKRFYLKACADSCVLHMNFEQLISLYHHFKELKPIYDALCADYDEGMVYRQRILEEKSAQRKIELFLIRYRPHLIEIQKKDICNYLKLNYDYFTSIYFKLL